MRLFWLFKKKHKIGFSAYLKKKRTFLTAHISSYTDILILTFRSVFRTRTFRTHQHNAIYPTRWLNQVRAGAAKIRLLLFAFISYPLSSVFAQCSLD